MASIFTTNTKISDLELDFIYDSMARERAAVEDEMMLMDSADAEYEIDRQDFDTLGRYSRSHQPSYLG